MAFESAGKNTLNSEHVDYCGFIVKPSPTQGVPNWKVKAQSAKRNAFDKAHTKCAVLMRGEK